MSLVRASGPSAPRAALSVLHPDAATGPGLGVRQPRLARLQLLLGQALEEDSCEFQGAAPQTLGPRSSPGPTWLGCTCKALTTGEGALGGVLEK